MITLMVSRKILPGWRYPIIMRPLIARAERYFEFAELGTGWKTEFLAGVDHVHDDGLHHLREPVDPA